MEGARDANLEKAALESCPQNLDEGRRHRSVAGPARAMEGFLAGIAGHRGNDATAKDVMYEA